MRSILNAIAAALRALSATAFRWVKKGGRWVLQMVSPGGGPALPPLPSVDEIVGDEPAPSATRSADWDRVRQLAIGMNSGVLEPGATRDVPIQMIRWLRACDRGMRVRISLASDDALRAHIRGHAGGIKGVVRSDAASIREYKEALARDAARARFRERRHEIPPLKYA